MCRFPHTVFERIKLRCNGMFDKESFPFGLNKFGESHHPVTVFSISKLKIKSVIRKILG